MLKVRKMINGEFFAQMKSKDADAENLEAVLTGNLEQLRAKLPKLANSFAKFHVNLTLKQLIKIADKMVKRRKHYEKGEMGVHWGELKIIEASGIDSLKRKDLLKRLPLGDYMQPNNFLIFVLL